MVLAGVIGISSSAIVSKLLVDLGRLANPESRLILGIIVVEDVFLALYLAMLQPVLGDADGVADAVTQSGRAFGFLLALTVLARWGLHGRALPRCDDVGTADPGARAPAAGRLRRDLLLAFGLSVDPGELAAVAGLVAAAVALTVVTSSPACWRPGCTTSAGSRRPTSR